VLARLGIYRGMVFQNQMSDLLAKKGVRTFKDLVHPAYADDPQYRYKVQIIASDVTQQRLLVLPRDAHLLGIEPDNLEVARAVRMSMSIPIFFVPVLHRNPRTKQLHIIVDGSLLSGFPVWLFDEDGMPQWPTFGLRLVEGDPKSSLATTVPPAASAGRIGRLVTFGKSLIDTMQNAHDRLYLERDVFARTIAIPTLGVDPHNFNVSATEVAHLYESGRAATRAFLQTWNFHAYIAAFRTGKPTSRRQEITEDMLRAAALLPAVAPKPPQE
jgi:NTE family protein